MKKEATILSVLTGLVVLSLIFFVIERVFGRGRTQPIIRKGWWTDVLYWVFTPLVTKQITKLVVIVPVTVLVLAHVTSVEALKTGAYRGFGPLSRLPVWVQVILIYVQADFIGYWSHRFFHSRRWWPFHAVHHSSEELDWLGSVRVHPVNDLLNNFALAACRTYVRVLDPTLYNARQRVFIFWAECFDGRKPPFFSENSLSPTVC